MKRNIIFPAFTLIELMIVITIISIISLATYFPYAHHQKKTLIKQAAREVTQSLLDARNLAIHGLDTGSGNLNVWLYFASWATQLDYVVSTWSLDIVSLPWAYKIKKLPRGIVVSSIDGGTGDRLFSFDSITGSGSISWSLTSDTVSILLSYRWTSSPVLQKEITYYTKSYISDY